MKHIIIAIILIFSMQLAFSQGDVKSKLDELLKEYYPKDNDPGIVLQVYDNNNNTIFAKGQGIADLKTGRKIDIHTNFRMASVSKQVTAAAIYQLIQENKIDVNTAKLSDFFPKLKGEIRNATIPQLLNHSSGIVDYEEIIPKGLKKQLRDSDVLKLIEPLDRVYFSPGTKFRYSNTAYCLLALIVEEVSGQGFSEYVWEHFFKPLNMQNSLVYNPEDEIKDRAFGYHLKGDEFVFADQSITSATKGDGGVYTSANEYKLWNQAFIQLLEKDPAYSDFLTGNLISMNKDCSYSIGKFIAKDQFGNLVYFHTGESTGFNNLVMSIPKKNINLSIFTNRDDKKINPFIEELLNILDIQLMQQEKKPVFKWLSDTYANEH
ncbi:serine hydrolase domain-containing protein [Sphingobacterium mizutaii]|uniref:serine hydrolase domain-containing protein n=1 Tax=Sphingobacterium mizutaii TaxID=1010 RepID=UPI0028AD3227|nr:serine hydrolase domain-containing protein [Sphingobacterium mizutaii]